LQSKKENGNWIHPRVALITAIVLAPAVLRTARRPGAIWRSLFFKQVDCRRSPAAVADCRRYFHRLPPAHSLCVRKFSCERCDWVLAATKEIPIPHWRSHCGGGNSIFPDHQFCAVGVIHWKLSKEFRRLGPVLYCRLATFLEHAGGRFVLCRVAVRRHGTCREAVPVAAGTARR